MEKSDMAFLLVKMDFLENMWYNTALMKGVIIWMSCF